jgi:hypothetical protein
MTAKIMAEGGFKRLIAIHPIINGECSCENPECKIAGKHPYDNGWQSQPPRSDHSISFMIERQKLDQYGVVLTDEQVLVVDEDPKNGGSITDLSAKIGVDLHSACGFTVRTGSGGHHLYFKFPENMPFTLASEDGIDFKRSGQVVGAGSMHRSGNRYEIIKGHPKNLTVLPPALVEHIKKEATPESEAVYTPSSEDDVEDMLSYLSPDLGYEDWLRVGMALHSGGHSFDKWHNWSSAGLKYSGESDMLKKWNSFSGDTVGMGTLVYMAKGAGYVKKVEVPVQAVQQIKEIDMDIFDPCVPPKGLACDLVGFINSQCRYPREQLAVLAGLSVLGNLVGLHHVDDLGATANLYSINVAASSTGKEAVQSVVKEILRTAKLGAFVYSSFKSEQAISRNIIEHQPSFYLMDELGEFLKKVTKAKDSYFTGAIAKLMEVYTKADDYYLLDGDQMREQKAIIAKQIDSVTTKIAKGVAKEEEDKLAAIKNALENELEMIDEGIKNPFVSLTGFTTASTLTHIMTEEMASNGLLSRCLISEEKEDNPKRKRGFKKPAMSEGLANRIRSAALFDRDLNQKRYACATPEHVIQTPEDVLDRLEESADFFEEQAEREKEKLGLVPLWRRGYEMVLKLSFIMACTEPSKRRTVEIVNWCHCFVVKNIETKRLLIMGNLEGSEDSKRSMKIYNKLDKEIGISVAGIKNQLRTLDPTEILNYLEAMVAAGKARKEEFETKKIGQEKVVKYFKI